MTIGRFKILVIGDVMLDRYIIGNHTRKSPEADVPIIDVIEVIDNLGGAANVAYNLKNLGSEAILFSVTGDDEYSQILNNLLIGANIECHLIKDNSRKTTVKSRVVDKNYNQFLRFDSEDKFIINNEIQQKLMDAVNDIINKSPIDAIVIQDYNKGILNIELIKFIQSIAKGRDIPLLVDPKVNNFQLLSNCSVFKPNFKELSIFSENVQISKQLESISKSIEGSKLKSDKIFITLAESGIYFKEKDLCGVIPGEKIENPDVSGAGDTVISVMTILFLMNYDAEMIAFLANKAGAFVCKMEGISTISKDDMQQIINKT